MLTSSEIRSRFLEFFKKRGHTIIPSASLVPENDPTTLFTSSGMQPLVPYLLGQPHPGGVRLANSQLSFRAGDIEETGDNRHTTFFEMLGNWSLGDYFKKEQLPWVYEFLIKELKLPKERLWITCFAGDEKLGLSKDTESAEIWKTIGVPEERILFYDAKKNWWSRAGVPAKMPTGEPGGPDSEIFFDFQTPHDKAFGEMCHPNCDCGRFMEIGNSVFMEYIKNADGTFGKLPKQNVDFGGGLERIAAAALDTPDIFKIDIFEQCRTKLEELSGKKYGEDKETTRAIRIVLDHMRAAVFIMAAGVRPSNTEQGYVLRRLLRRSMLFINKLKQNPSDTSFLSLGWIAETFINIYKEEYSHLVPKQSEIQELIIAEENKFFITLAQGMRELEKMGNNVDAFLLFTTYGFPVELTAEIAQEKGITVDMNAMKKKMGEHQALSRAGAAQKFAGGLADHAEKTVRLHTAHHILLRALQVVLGSEVHQRGSNITQERLRIDFAAPRKMTDEEKKEVERIVNEKIAEKLPVIRSEMSLEEAEKLGAEHEFGQKYPDRVSVYSVGPKDATQEDPKFDKRFSIEFCGGPHVKNTSELGKFRILKEEAVAQGVRRIKAVLE
ncbi:MAG: alanine--tRNA ligase [bacterium]|nr:alanine--tRNA ligase [bacterium]